MFPIENNFKRTKILFPNGLIWMSLVCKELTGIIIALQHNVTQQSTSSHESF